MSERDLINLAEEHDDMFDLFMADQGVITTRAKWKARALKAEATIARLSEALAEAEKKGAEDAARIEAMKSTLPKDVIELVLAARAVLFERDDERNLLALDRASEAFASRVPWDGEEEVDNGNA